jgi:hypothetical protein
MRRFFFLISLCLSLICGAQELPDSLSVGFVTCEPGPEIFELYGHEGVRVSGRVDGQNIDVVFNYGVFDFSSPGFVWRFVKGETDYMAVAQPTDLFLYPYRKRGSRVIERVMPLSQQEARQMYERLLDDVRPENSTYRYKYFTNNCATKPLAHLTAVTGERLKPRDDHKPVTYRELLKQYNEGYPWYQFGIDLVLGYELDKPVTPRQMSFVPVELDRLYFSRMPQRVLNEGEGDCREPATPFLLSPLFVSLLLFLVALVMNFKRMRSRVAETVWFALQGMAGVLVCGLAFFSEHEGTSPNLLCIWLNPLWLAIPVLVWLPRCRKVCQGLMSADAAVTGLLLICWPLLPQSTDPAVFPLMGATVLFASAPLWQARGRKRDSH